MNNLSVYTILLLPYYLNAFPLPEEKVSNDLEYELRGWINFEFSLRANDNLSLNLISNMAINVSMSSDSLNDPTPKKKSLTLLITFFVVAFFSMLVNIRAFCIVFLTSKRKSRPVNILVAHLSFVVIMLTFLGYTYVLEKSEVINLSAPGLCNLVMYLRNGFYYVLPINTVAIVYVRIRNDAVILRKSVAYRIIGLTWVITLISNLPSIWSVEYVSSSKTKMSECREVSLLGSLGATTAYDVLRLLFFNVLVSLYMIRAAIKIRTIIQYLQASNNINSKSMERRTRGARLVYFQTILFIVNWLPLGFGILLYQIFNRSSWKDTYVNYLTPFVFLYSNVIILSPLSYVYLVEQMSIAEIIAPCFSARSRSSLTANQATIRQDNLETPHGKLKSQLKPKSDRLKSNSDGLPTGNRTKNENNDKSFLTSEMSRISTFGVTEVVKSEDISMANMRPLPQPVQSTAVTSFPTKSAKFEVNLLPNEPINKGELAPLKRNSEILV